MALAANIILDPMMTGVAAVRGIVMFVIPFVFAFYPDMTAGEAAFIDRTGTKAYLPGYDGTVDLGALGVLILRMLQRAACQRAGAIGAACFWPATLVYGHGMASRDHEARRAASRGRLVSGEGETHAQIRFLSLRGLFLAHHWRGGADRPGRRLASNGGACVICAT